MENKSAIELIEIKGHIIDSLILPQIFDEIVEAGGEFEVVEFVIGKTNIATKIRISGSWIDVQNQEMDCAIKIDENQIPKCVHMSKVKKGDNVVIGRHGIRVMPTERPREGTFLNL